MAIDATTVFRAHREGHGLSDDECKRMCAVASYCQTADDSKAIDERSGPMIVISAIVGGLPQRERGPERLMRELCVTRGLDDFAQDRQF